MARPTNTARNGRLRQGQGRNAVEGALSPIDRFLAMSDYEKEAVWRDLDRPISASTTRAMTSAERRQWEQARRRPGRPKIGKGTKVVSISIEKELLKWVDSYARKAGLSRARFLAIAVESFRDDARRYRLISNAFDTHLRRNGKGSHSASRVNRRHARDGRNSRSAK